MSYGQTRDDEQLSRLDNSIRDFIIRYNSNSSSINRKTIMFFPGGIGSQLLRATKKEPQGPPFSYDKVWLDCSIAFGAALDLQMHGDVDKNHQVVIPDGPVKFVTVRPYARFIRWCEAMGIDYFIFGWDWRRGLKLTVDFFLNSFMPLFRERVQATCSPDPLQHFALVGHSFGGMIVKLILNESDNAYVRLMKHAVTVATPFYGYGGQVARYFIGDPDLFRLGYGRRELTRVVSSLAAGYTLMFLDEETYNRDGPALSRDADYPLTAYPIKDSTHPAQVADPYNPKSSGGKVRYPQNYGFNTVELRTGKIVYQQVAAPLDPVVNTKFFNIRGVQAENGAVVKNTVTRQTWDWIAPTFDPETDPSPITDYLGPGDGTLPAWSTRLVSTPAANIRSLHGALDHMHMMSNPQILDELAKILDMTSTPRRQALDRERSKIVSRDDLNTFLNGLAKVHNAVDHVDATIKRQTARKYLQQFDRETLRGYVGRVFADALNSPSQKLGTAKAPSATKGESLRRSTLECAHKLARSVLELRYLQSLRTLTEAHYYDAVGSRIRELLVIGGLARSAAEVLRTHEPCS